MRTTSEIRIPCGAFDVPEPSTERVRYSRCPLLATVEAIFNLGTLGRNDSSATPMSDLFTGPIP